MASATRIHISSDTHGVFHTQKDPSVAETVSELLQHNLEQWHSLFSESRHNHIVHCLLSAYALGASSAELRKIYARESAYQLPAPPIDESHVRDMKDKDRFKEFLDKPEHYSSFLAFFQREIEAQGAPAVLNEHLFANDEHANRLLTRFFGGLVHSFIHIGFGLEFNQPALIAEGLAQNSIHEEPSADRMLELLLDIEKQAGGIGKPGKKTFVEIMDEMRKDEELRQSHHGVDKVARVRNVIRNAPKKFVKYASQYSISADQLEERYLELITSIPSCIAPSKDQFASYKIDFGALHPVNANIFLPVFFKLDWLSASNKIRLFEWTGRNWLLLLVSQGSPPFNVDGISPPKQNEEDWRKLFSRSINHPSDDGHLVKLVRALAHGNETTKGGHNEKFLLNGPMWLTLANYAVDSVSTTATTSEERWKYIALE